MSSRVSANDAAAPPPPSALEWSIETEPSTADVTMAQRATLRLWIVVHNRGNTTVDTRRDQIQFAVDGTVSLALAMAFGNGARESRWSALPSNATVREARDMGETLFPAPGTYTITMRLDGREVARRVIHVER